MTPTERQLRAEIDQLRRDLARIPVRYGATGGHGIQLWHGIIIEQCNAGCSTYRVQRVHRYLKDTCEDCGDGSGSGSGSG